MIKHGQMVDVISISELLKMNLSIPDYQRPYKWTHKNMVELLNDLTEAVSCAEKFEDFRYRVGTVILHTVSKSSETYYDIVDGQQRILSLVIIMLCLQPEYTCPLLEYSTFRNGITQKNLYDNYVAARDFLSADKECGAKILAALTKTIEVVTICVDNENKAFQLFDSQNTRGRPLDPHDLLKAYHLREMREYPYEMRHAVTKWESVDAVHIRDLFSRYLFPIRNWSAGRKSYPFTVRSIDCYKGIPETSTYTYAKRANNAMPYFQITAPFLAGGSFFEMVDHYLKLVLDIQTEITTKPEFQLLKDVLENKEFESAGFSYAKNLFYCALLCYYDKFHNFDERVVRKLFTWALMLRVDMKNLGFDSINRYAIGEGENYTNTIKMFSVITDARLHSEIANLPIKVQKKEAPVDKWKPLYEKLKELNGIGGAGNE